MFQGVGYAMFGDRLPASFFEPICQSPEEAEDRAFDFNASRSFAKAVAGLKG